MANRNLWNLASSSVNLDDPTHKQTQEQQAMADEVYLNNLCDDLAEAEKLRKYDAFYRAAKAEEVNVEETLKDIPTKKRHLIEILGYPALKGKNGKSVRLCNAKHSRIGKAYRDHYNRAQKCLYSFDN